MPDTLRIAVWYNLPSGGAKRALSYHVRGLVARGHHVEIWSPPVRDPHYEPLGRFAIEHIVPLQDEYTPERRGPAAKTIPGRVKQYVNLYRDWLAEHDRHAIECARQIDAGDFDVVLAHNCWRLHAPFIGRHLKTPKALYLHEPRRPLYEAIEGSVWMPLRAGNLSGIQSAKQRIRDYYDIEGKRLQIEAEYLNAAAFDRILVNSLYSRESVIRAYGLDATVCYLGVDTELFHPTGLPKEPYVVTVGHVSPPKNTKFLIEAIAAMPEPRPKLVLITHGLDATYDPECRELAAKLGVELDYRFQIPDSDLVETLSEASVLAYAAKLEPFGFAPLEANACGTAAVAVAEGGPRESIVDGVNGFLVNNNVREMARAIQRFTGNLPFAASMGAKSAEHIQQHWTVKHAVDNVERNLREVAG